MGFPCLGLVFGMATLRQWQALLLLLVLLSSTGAYANAKTRLLVSIKPLALIAQEVGGDDVILDTLLPVTASAHDYPLKMSDHRRLREADLILWVGPELESFLARPLANLPSARIITSYDLGGLFWPEAIDHGHSHTSVDHHAEHQHGTRDPHLWLDPRNAAVIAQALAQRLGELQPAQAGQFQARAQAFAQAVAELDTQLAAQLAPIKTRGFVVYHEGYSHFVGRYGLHQLAYVTFTPERRPGAKHLQELRQVLAKEGRCVFLEPYHNSRALEDMAQSLSLNLGMLDAIGSEGTASYLTLMRQLAQSFSACLANTAQG